MSEGERSLEEVTKDLFWALEKLEELEVKHEGALRTIKALGNENDELLKDLQSAVTEIEEMEVNSALLCRQVAYLQEENSTLKDERDALTESLLQMEDRFSDTMRPVDLKKCSTIEAIEEIRQEERRKTIVILKEKQLAHQTILQLQAEKSQMQQQIEELVQLRQDPTSPKERQASDNTLGASDSTLGSTRSSKLYSILDRADGLAASGWINQAVDLFVKRERESDESEPRTIRNREKGSSHSINREKALPSFKSLSSRFITGHQPGAGGSAWGGVKASSSPDASPLLSQSSHSNYSQTRPINDLVCDFGHARRSFSLDLSADRRRQSQTLNEEDLARHIREQTTVQNAIKEDVTNDSGKASNSNFGGEGMGKYPSVTQYSASLKTIDNEITGLLERPSSVPPLKHRIKKVTTSPVA